jgi:hypothetical protein
VYDRLVIRCDALPREDLVAGSTERRAPQLPLNHLGVRTVDGVQLPGDRLAPGSEDLRGRASHQPAPHHRHRAPGGGCPPCSLGTCSVLSLSCRTTTPSKEWFPGWTFPAAIPQTPPCCAGPARSSQQAYVLGAHLVHRIKNQESRIKPPFSGPVMHHPDLHAGKTTGLPRSGLYVGRSGADPDLRFGRAPGQCPSRSLRRLSEHWSADVVAAVRHATSASRARVISMR